MSKKIGKVKDWGSRTGRKSKSETKTPSMELSNLTTEALEDLLQDPVQLLSSLQVILEKRNSFKEESPVPLKKYFQTKHGKLFHGSCFELLNTIEDNSIDCIFADPPFNLAKDYDNGTDDKMNEADYLEWSRAWIDLCIKKLKHGGSFFLYNIPKWNIPLADYMNKKLNFRHWITVDMTFSMPIPNKLYPSHYALLYYVKGEKPNTFTPPRTPIKTCNRCGQEQNDYGGYKNKMNPLGINIRDVWSDIPPVRHAKFKNRDANELSIKLLDRVLDIATREGDLVFDPFGGSGTTYIVAELKNRRWIGSELGDCSVIKERFLRIKEEGDRLAESREALNTLFTDKALQIRLKSGLGFKNYNISNEQIERVLAKSKNKQMSITQ
ncbi:MAG: site-specific DNA-methyltransferase [Bacteriovoracaceae bacterium]|nr:site-specific DNA-methyltransferase [Bacteriovoracaceae bacterium]